MTLFGLLGGLLKQSSMIESRFLLSRVFELVIDAINNVDLSNPNVKCELDNQSSKHRKARELPSLRKNLNLIVAYLEKWKFQSLQLWKLLQKHLCHQNLLDHQTLMCRKKFAWNDHQETRNEIGL